MQVAQGRLDYHKSSTTVSKMKPQQSLEQDKPATSYKYATSVEELAQNLEAVEDEAEASTVDGTVEHAISEPLTPEQQQQLDAQRQKGQDYRNSLEKSNGKSNEQQPGTHARSKWSKGERLVDANGNVRRKSAREPRPGYEVEANSVGLDMCGLGYKGINPPLYLAFNEDQARQAERVLHDWNHRNDAPEDEEE